VSFLRTLAGADALADDVLAEHEALGQAQRELQAALGEFDTVSPLLAFLAGKTDAGKLVTVERALGITAVYAAIRILSDTVGMLPLKVWARLQGGGVQEAWYDPAHRLLSETPNQEMTAATLWSLVMAHLNAWGDAFLGKEFDSSGRVSALWPIRPDHVRVERKGGVKLYWIRDNLGREDPTPYTDADVVHIMGMSIDGLRGLSPIQLAKQAFGAGLALDEYANHFWSNSALPSLAVIGPENEQLVEDARDRRERKWQRKFRGSRRSNKVVFLEHGTTLQPISVPLADAQFIEQQKWGVQQAARVFRVPMSLIAGESVDSSLTYRTVESDAIHFLTHSVQPWLVRIEQSLHRHSDIFPRRSLYSQFDVEELLRSDIKTRAYATSLAVGGKPWAKPSEVRPGWGYSADTSLDDAPAGALPAAGGEGK
jgi:HK97 family phage portal protein